MKRNMLQKGLLVVAILLILAGLHENGFKDMKNKAIRICYECIGIG